MLEFKRIIKVTKGGRNFRFFTVVAVGDSKGSIGIGFGKSTEVMTAKKKALAKAKKNMFKIPILKETIPHYVRAVFCSSEVVLRPARPGAGASVGGTIRALMDLLGIRNISGKTYGSNNKMNVVQATIKALKQLRFQRDWQQLRQEKGDNT